jgi:hypothetical protein
MPTAAESVHLDIEMTPELAAKLESLASGRGESPGEIFSLAIALLDVAWQGKQRGQKLGLANPETQLITEIGL